MRKFLYFGVLAIASLMTIGLSSCGKRDIFGLGARDAAIEEYVDSTVAAGVQNYVNPVFNTVDEVLTFRTNCLEGQAIDEAFNQMPESVLKNVASVCIKREGHVSKRAIVYEYRANSSIYNNLPSPDSTKTSSNTQVPSTSTAAGGQPYRPDTVPMNETKYNQHDTTIGGKTYKVHIKTETKYE
jgi:hypothetical protein